MTEYTVKKRLDLLKKINYKIDAYKRVICVKKMLGEGAFGSVYLASVKMEGDKTDDTIAVKRQVINEKYEKYIFNPFNEDVLTGKLVKNSDDVFIDLAAGQMLSELVLQKICPHFVLNYSWDGTIGQIVSYVELYNEYIDDAQIFYDWAKEKHSDHEWANVFFQVLVAIYAMQKHYNMTHNDLHGANILIKKVKKGGYYKYKIDGTDYYVPNLGNFVLVNDYGLTKIPKKLVPDWFKGRKDKHNLNIDVKEFYKNLNIKGAPKKFKNEYLDIFKHITDIDVNDLIMTFYAHSKFSPDISTKECNDVPYFCYNKIKPKGKLIDSFNVDAKLKLTYIHKDLARYIKK